MAGPWEKFQAPVKPSAAPWEKFQQDTQPKVEPEWRRGALAPVETIRDPNTGEVTDRRWAVPQIAMDVWDAVKLPGDALKGDVQYGTDDYYRRAANFGMTFTPSTLQTKGAATLAGKKIPKKLVQALKNDGISIDDLGRSVADLGEGALAADVSPGTQALTKAIATTPGKGQKTVVDALMKRKAGAGARIAGGVDDAFGAGIRPGVLDDTLKAGKSAISDEYTDLFKTSDATVNIKPLAASVDDMIKTEKGKARKVLQGIRKDMNNIDGKSLDDTPEGLMKTRHAIDGALAGENDPNVKRVLADFRKQVDTELTSAVPGVKDLDAKYVELARQSEGYKAGGKALSTGKTTFDPGDFAEQVIQGVTPQGKAVGPSAAAYRMKQGTKQDINRLIGSKGNDRQALKQAVTADGKWNHQKLTSLIGKEKADKLVALLENEMRQYLTEQEALFGSKTAGVTAAQELLKGSDKIGAVRSAANLNFGDAVVGAADFIKGPFKTQEQQAIANALMSSGKVNRVPSAVPAPVLAAINANRDKRNKSGGGF